MDLSRIIKAIGTDVDILEGIENVALFDEADINRACGLCSNVFYMIWDHDVYKEILKTWPKYTKDCGYPVPAPEGCGIYPHVLYTNAIRAGSLYDGPYGVLRLELLAHVKHVCKEILKHYKKSVDTLE